MKYSTAVDIVLKKGRGYLYKKKYPQVVVYTRDVGELDKLKQAFGGHSHGHKNGFVWIVSHRGQLSAMLAQLEGRKSQHDFEEIINNGN